MQGEYYFVILQLVKQQAMQNYITTFIGLLNEMSPYLLLGFLIAGILHEFVPQEIYRTKLSKGNFRSVFLAALFGVPLPLCSCGVLPTAMSLRREGVSKGATTSFLISTPQTGVDSIMATASLLGLPFAIIRPIAAFITALVGGSLVNSLCKEEKQPIETAKQSDKKEKSFLARCVGALRYGFVDFLQDIGKWITIGLLLAGVITVIVPDNFFTAFNDMPIVNMLIVMAFAVPMYLCATGSIPIAAALMLKGLTPGAALVLLMAGPASSIASILIINKVLGRRTLIVYLSTIIGGAFCFGLMIDYLLPLEWFGARIATHSTECCTGETTAWWKSASSILFALLIAASFIMKFIKPKKDTKMQDSFKIKGMMCNHCKANVEKNLAKVEGVTNVRVELAEGTAYIDGTFDRNKIIETINELGYEYIAE